MPDRIYKVHSLKSLAAKDRLVKASSLSAVREYLLADLFTISLAGPQDVADVFTKGGTVETADAASAIRQLAEMKP